MAEISGVDKLIEQLTNLSFTRNEKAQATKAGAEVVAHALHENTPVDLENEDGKHLKDMVTFENNQYKDGSTNVGFTKEGYYGRFVNDGHATVEGRTYHLTRNGTRRMKKISQLEKGTKRTKAAHFIQTTVINSKEAEKQAVIRELRKIINRKGH